MGIEYLDLLEEQVDKAINKINRLTQEKQDLLGNISELESKIQQLTDEIGHLREENSSLNLKLSQIPDISESREREIKKRLEELKDKIERHIGE
ncbi:MAG: hypothetical protein B6D65_02130 [candidate division Zixibacteria bacterium 4484_93]|nr:MAG: hypothetical protein B6D65_02130 [candidate division Zixibacteria bacterium 4484_93]